MPYGFTAFRYTQDCGFGGVIVGWQLCHDGFCMQDSPPHGCSDSNLNLPSLDSMSIGFENPFLQASQLTFVDASPCQALCSSTCSHTTFSAARECVHYTYAASKQVFTYSSNQIALIRDEGSISGSFAKNTEPQKSCCHHICKEHKCAASKTFTLFVSLVDLISVSTRAAHSTGGNPRCLSHTIRGLANAYSFRASWTQPLRLQYHSILATSRWVEISGGGE